MPSPVRTSWAVGLLLVGMIGADPTWAADASSKSEAAAFLRPGKRDLSGLATYAGQGGPQWGEARNALLRKFANAYARGAKDSSTWAHRDVRTLFVDLMDATRPIEDPKLKQAAWLLIMEAILALDWTLKGHLPSEVYTGRSRLLDAPEQERKMLELICTRLGITPADLEPDYSKNPKAPKLEIVEE